MDKRVSLFVTCMVDQLFPKVGMAMAAVLEGLGYQVDFPEGQTCCGQPAFNSGYRAEARMVARHFLDTFESSECIVVPSGSCTAMVARHFADLFHKDPAALARVHALENIPPYIERRRLVRCGGDHLARMQYPIGQSGAVAASRDLI